MTKELSKQLCELCGIEGKWIEYETETTDGCINLGSKLVYPDFTKPENFVRLLKIGLDIFKEFRLERHSMSMEPEEKLITDCLIRTSDDFYPVNKLKQSIREAEWVYEG